MHLHITQMLYDGGTELNCDGDQGMIHIQGKVTKDGKHWIAKKATEYWIENEDDEMDQELDLTEAMQHLTRCVPVGSANIKDKFCVYDRDTEKLYILIWKNKEGNVCCMDIQKK